MPRAALCIGLLLLAPPLTQAAESRPNKGEYVFILRARGNPYWTTVSAGITDTAKAEGLDAKIYELSDDKAAEEQLNTCQAAIERKPVFIAISSATPAVGMQCLKQAQAAGITVADLDHTLSVDEARQGGLTLAYSVGSDNAAIGAKAAEFAASVTGDAPHILVLEGAAGSLPGQQRVDGFTGKFKKLKPDAAIVSLPADWDRLKAQQAAADALQRDPGISLIYAANDLMALGAAEAVQSAGNTGKVQIVGVDGTADARQAVRDGKLTATVAQLPYLIGKRSVELAIDAVARHTVEREEVTPTPILSQKSLKDNSDPDLAYVR